MKATHTPGPWEVSERKNGRWLVGRRARVGGTGRSSRLSVLWTVANGLPAHDNTAEGNARLIAAAPDLLIAAQAAVTWCDQGGPADWALIQDFAVLLRAAIQKAEGR